MYARTPVDPTDKDYIYRGLDFGLEMIPYEQTILQVIQSNYYNNRFDGIVKSHIYPVLSFLRKQESSYFNMFWTPAFAGVTIL